MKRIHIREVETETNAVLTQSWLYYSLPKLMSFVAEITIVLRTAKTAKSSNNVSKQNLMLNSFD